MARYQLFVDDSGTREYDDNRNYETSGKSLYFVYGAILMRQDAAASILIPRLRHLKLSCFKTTRVEIKSNWLRRPRERQFRYLGPFNLADDQLDAFVESYYRLLGSPETPFELIAAVVNKARAQETYASPWYAPTLAYEYLLQRAVQAVPQGSTLGVTIDQIGGSTPKSSQYQTLLAAHHDALRKHGSRLQPQISFACLDSAVRFVPSQDSEPVQAADLVSYNVHRQFRDHGEQWENAPPTGGPLPMYPYFRRLAGKFRRDRTGRVQGYGIVKAPLLNRVQWTYRPRTTP